MAYEKHTWETGEVITADKLNYIEDALEGSGSEGMNIQIAYLRVDENGATSYNNTPAPMEYVNDIDNKVCFAVIHTGEGSALTRPVSIVTIHSIDGGGSVKVQCDVSGRLYDLANVDLSNINATNIWTFTPLG